MAKLNIQWRSVNSFYIFLHLICFFPIIVSFRHLIFSIQSSSHLLSTIYQTFVFFLIMTTDRETILREKLKVALQDAKKLYDDGLLDENEFKQLKTHELTKYKEELSIITSNMAKKVSSASTPIPPSITPPNPKSQFSRKDLTPLGTPMRPSPMRPMQIFISPHAAKKANADSVVVVDPNTYKRLTTPPIFRRRAPKKRKIVLPSAQLKALQDDLSDDK